MTDRDALLLAVLDAPDDDLPRLVFADWCDDNGEADLARFVRLQIALTTLRHDHRHQSFGGSPCRACKVKREFRRFMNASVLMRPYPWVNRVLDDWGLELSAHGWGKSVGGAYGERAHFRRGFVDRVEMTHDRFLKDAGVLFAEHPIRHVILIDKEPWPNSVDPYTDEVDGVFWQSTRMGDLLRRRGFDIRERPVNINQAVFKHLTGRSEYGNKVYETHRAANTDLSDACVAYGREQAGLPPLSAQVCAPREAVTA